MVLGLEKLNISTSAQNMIFAVLGWFAWNITKKYLAPYLPEQAVTLIDTGLVAAGAVALTALLTNIRNSVNVAQQTAVEAKVAALDAKDEASLAKLKASETKMVATETRTVVKEANKPGGSVDTLVRNAIEDRPPRKDENL